jgi:hypothetical protein
MSPVRYETKQDRSNEDAVAEAAAAAWGWTQVKIGKDEEQARLDRYFFRPDGTLAAVAEIKCRRHDKGRYPDVPLELAKRKALLRYQWSVPGLFIVRWRCGAIGWLDAIWEEDFWEEDILNTQRPGEKPDPAARYRIGLFSDLSARPC